MFLWYVLLLDRFFFGWRYEGRTWSLRLARLEAAGVARVKPGSFKTLTLKPWKLENYPPRKPTYPQSQPPLFKMMIFLFVKVGYGRSFPKNGTLCKSFTNKAVVCGCNCQLSPFSCRLSTALFWRVFSLSWTLSRANHEQGLMGWPSRAKCLAPQQPPLSQVRRWATSLEDRPASTGGY